MQPNQQLTTENGFVPDPKILKVVQTLRQIESGGDYNAVGDGGDAYGAFQYNEKTGPGWKNIARQYLGDENAPMDRANQNKATYMRIADWKNQGFQLEEIPALWNGATKTPEGKYTCINPEYCKKFRETLMGSGQAAPIGPTQFQTTVPRETPGQSTVLSQLGTGTIEPPKEPGMLDKRLQQGSEALGKLSTGIAEGDVSDIASGALQTTGTLAGGAIDLTDRALNFVTLGGYDAAMDFIGKKIVAPALSAVGGERVYQEWQEFATEHPDAAKNIGAVGNIASVLPIFKALRVGGGMVADAARTGAAKTGFVKTVEEATKAEIRQSGASAPSKAGQVLAPKDLKGKSVDPVDTIVDGDYLPDVVEDANGIPRYNSTAAIKKLDDELDMNEQALQRGLEEASRKGLVGYVPISALRTQADEVIKKAFANQGNVGAALKKVNKIFDDYTTYKGDLVPLTELNDMKRGIREAVNFNSPKLSMDVRTHLGSLFMETIEDVAEKQGMKMVADLNRDSMIKIRAKEALEFLNERSVVEKPGFRTMLGRRGGDVGTIAGESVGQTFGIPGVGAAIGRGITNRAISGVGKSSAKRLKSKRNRKPLGKAQTAAALGVLQTRHTQEEPNQVR